MSCRFFLVSFVLAAGCASGNPYERTLANGLRVIIKEDNRAPTVSHLVWYRVGSMDETNGVTGVAHVLEHMMFKGTRTVPPGDFSRRVAAAGGGFPLRIDSNRKLLNEWATVGFYRLPERWLADFPREVERVTATDIRAAFARHVQPERFVTVVVGADEGK